MKKSSGWRQNDWLGGKAVSTMAELLDSDSERIRLATASEILRHLSDMPIGSSSAEAIKSQRTMEALEARSNFGQTF